MINITRKLPDSNFIGDVESMFNLHVDPTDFNDNDLKAMREIDNAELLDRNTGLIKTPYGLCSVKNLSTGCKTVLVYNHCYRNGIRKIINANESGANALAILFDIIDSNNDNDTKLYLIHRNKMYMIPEHDFNVDGKRGRNLCLI